jgi:ABC-type oligopeptide transport system substrate-binding subunit
MKLKFCSRIIPAIILLPVFLAGCGGGSSSSSSSSSAVTNNFTSGTYNGVYYDELISGKMSLVLRSDNTATLTTTDTSGNTTTYTGSSSSGTITVATLARRSFFMPVSMPTHILFAALM